MTELCDALSAPKEELAALWSDTFGDPRAFPLNFLEKLPAFGFGWAAMEGGHVLGAAYGVDAFTLGGEKIAYLYAVAVRPDARGQGLGAALAVTAGTAALMKPGKMRKRRQAIRALGRVADDIRGVMKFF